MRATYILLLMTVFNATTDLPAAVNTESKLLAFAVLAVLKMYAAKTYNEVEGQSPAPVITGSIVRAADGTDRLIGRFSLPLLSTWATDPAKLFLLTQELGTVTWPTEYKA